MVRKGGVGKRKVSMTIDNSTYSQFKKYCSDNGMKVSTKVERLMKDSLKNTSLIKFI